MGEASVLVVEHRFPAARSLAAACGTFNVGLLSFRRDPQGLACLRWWRERCIEWCYDRTEEGRFADQKYLDQWPTLFTGVVAAQHKGVGSAPWNLATYPIRRDGSTVRIGGDRLIVYHFHGFQRVGRWAYQTGLGIYGARFDPLTRRFIYRPYLQALRRAEQLSARYRADAPAAAAVGLSRTAPRSAWAALKACALRMRQSPAQAVDRFRQLVQGGFLITWGERVW